MNNNQMEVYSDYVKTMIDMITVEQIKAANKEQLHAMNMSIVGYIHSHELFKVNDLYLDNLSDSLFDEDYGLDSLEGINNFNEVLDTMPELKAKLDLISCLHADMCYAEDEAEMQQEDDSYFTVEDYIEMTGTSDGYYPSDY